jgi:hypothetical protein
MKRELPRDVRFPHSQRGELSYKGTWFPCLIQDISVSGFFIICARDPEIGQELGVRFELYPRHFLHCKIRVQHIENGCFGAEITEAGEQESKAFQQFIEKRFKELKCQPSTV